MLQDEHGRSVSYMRISVTDRCNLRCFYCRSLQEPTFIPHPDILRYEEILGLIGLARNLDVRKIRLTGGEPFARRDFMEFLDLLHMFPDLDVRLTTNGTLMAGLAPRMRALGMSHINISLDTLQPHKFKEITGVDAYSSVRTAIDECMAAGLKVKLNAVAIRGFNDNEMGDFMAFAAANTIDLRFIEFMPMGGNTQWDTSHCWTADAILEEASRHATLVPLDRDNDDAGPARMYGIEGGKGRIGLISPLSAHFCSTCNRLRITSDGRLRTCLFSDKEYRLRPILRHRKLGLAKVAEVIRLASRNKPIGHELLEARRRAAVCGKIMSAIGG
ncbi:MAG: GTP 3',8-cyclase MoaA [Desulfovibrionaceae bacterium]